jgi:hypothetical protein
MVRFISLYYRDENKVMQKIPHLEIRIDNKGSLVYTLPPLNMAKIRLNQPKLKESM